MILVLFAIFLTVLMFVFSAVVSIALLRERPVPNYRMVHRRYAYRSEPHADQTTLAPNRLRDNEITGG